ncbi:hypothetical protein [Streptomyces sp. NPDC056949]|uniref:hypothetical protein n=1 Tax=Streptomyces sp. NPDC056949 TaxID=3345976 RepID=UPI0036368FAF
MTVGLLMTAGCGTESAGPGADSGSRPPSATPPATSSSPRSTAPPEPDLGALPTPSHPVAGVDGSPGAGRTFNVAQVKSALLRPGEIHPSGTTEAEANEGDINQWSGLAAGWEDCGTQVSGLLKELGGLHGPRAQYIARRPLTAEEASKRPPDGSRTAVGFERVASLPDPQAERYLELQYQLHKSCPSYMRDTDGAPESEFRAVERLTGLGDQAILAARGRSTNPNDPENSGVRWSYTVEVRIGTLLVTVTTEQAAEGSPDDVVALAARAAQHVRDTLHAQAPTPTASGGAG